MASPAKWVTPSSVPCYRDYRGGLAWASRVHTQGAPTLTPTNAHIHKHLYIFAEKWENYTNESKTIY